MQRAIQAGADSLREKLGEAGTGVHYPGQSNRSSRSGEYPARQTGDLQASIDSQVTGPLSGVIGALNSPPKEALMLHITPESKQGRPFVIYALHDPEYLSAIDEAVKRG